MCIRDSSNSKEAGMSFKEEKLEERPVIVGMGPAGLFAALVLARAGFAPVVFEDVYKRQV